LGVVSVCNCAGVVLKTFACTLGDAFDAAESSVDGFTGPGRSSTLGLFFKPGGGAGGIGGVLDSVTGLTSGGVLEEYVRRASVKSG
jgi:hypothetical protein